MSRQNQWGCSSLFNPFCYYWITNELHGLNPIDNFDNLNIGQAYEPIKMDINCNYRHHRAINGNLFLLIILNSLRLNISMSYDPQNQLQKNQVPATFKATYYARRNQNEPPFLVEVDVRPYVPDPENKTQYVQFTAGYGSDPVKQSLPNQPNYPAQQQSIQNLNGLPIQNLNLDNNKCKGVCKTIMLSFLSLFNVISTVAFAFFIVIASYSVQVDHFRSKGLVCLWIIIFSYSVVLIYRGLFHGIYALASNARASERIGLLLSVFCPLLKYQIFSHIGTGIGSRLDRIYNLDIASIIFSLAAGISSLVGYGYAYTVYQEPWWPYNIYYYEDGNFIVFGVVIIVATFFDIIGMIVHSRFIKQTLEAQKISRLNNYFLLGNNNAIQNPPSYPQNQQIGQYVQPQGFIATNTYQPPNYNPNTQPINAEYRMRQ